MGLCQSVFTVDPFATCAPDKSGKSLINATNNIISQSITKTITNCFVSQIANQSIRIKCKPILPNNVTVYEENDACRLCNLQILTNAQYQDNLERIQWKSSPAIVRQPIDIMYQSLFSQAQACGENVCKACSLSNITQINITNSNSECISISMNSIDIKSNINTLIQQQLLNNQDVLSGAAQTFGIQNLTSLSETISNTIMTVVSSQFLNDLRQILQQSQVIELVSDTSVSVSNISQASMDTVTQKFVSEAAIAENAFGQETFDSISIIANSQNTLNDVGNVVINSSVSFLKAIDTAVGEVTLAVLVLLGVVVIGIICYFAFINIKKITRQQTQRSLNNL